jgi:hypothetical protein
VQVRWFRSGWRGSVTDRLEQMNMHKSEMELEEQRLVEEVIGKFAADLACQLAMLQAEHCRKMGMDLKYLLSKKQHRVYEDSQTSAQLPKLRALVDLVSELKGDLRLQAVSPSADIFVCALGDEDGCGDKKKELQRAHKLMGWISQWLNHDATTALSLAFDFSNGSYEFLPRLVSLAKYANFIIRIDVCVDGRPVDQPLARTIKTG